MTEHTDRLYEEELGQLRQKILLMGARVEAAVTTAVKSLAERNDELAKGVQLADHEINRMEIEADELCLRILARRQPVASDLRFITTALKLVTDLERIADLGVNISERVLELNCEPPLKHSIDMPKMAEAALSMVRDALDAFVNRDPKKAEAIMQRDNIVDAYYAQIFRELLGDMMQSPASIFRATRLQSIGKYLERIADHATNLAENVVFMVNGKDVRHPYSRELGKAER